MIKNDDESEQLLATAEKLRKEADEFWYKAKELEAEAEQLKNKAIERWAISKWVKDAWPKLWR